jgi:hypothetical protein
MNEEYLWNRTGEPDAETVRLEQLLGQLKYRPATKRPRRTVPYWWLAAAAALVAGVVAAPLLWRGPLTNWRLQDGAWVRTGQTIETNALSKVKIESRETGEVTVGPGSRLRLVAASGHEQHFDLQRGTIHAFIWAPPGRFVVDTPSSKTIDLGCRYTLQVAEDGNGVLTVELGWVAFERNHLESFIPAGAMCVTRPVKGPGTPYFSDAPEVLTKALARFDTSGDFTALDTAIGTARQRDALSLWHLMIRTQGNERAKVFDRFAALMSLPPEATREAILRGDGKAMDAAWDALGLGNTSWWREWKKPW